MTSSCDDTIYVAQVFAAALYQGALRGMTGETSGARAEGDFAVAYVLAHEYAHNLQQELEIFDTPERRDALLLGFRSGDPSACRRFVPE